MYSATFPRRGLEPLRIGQRAFRDQPQLLTFSLGHRRVLTGFFIYIACDTDWYSLRCSCSQILVFWADPTLTPDPPVAQAFGPEQLSDGDNVSDVSG